MSLSSTRQMALSYITATTTAVATAVGMNMLTKVLSGLLWAGWPQGGSKVLAKTRHFPSLGELGMTRAEPSHGWEIHRGRPHVGLSLAFEGVWLPRWVSMCGSNEI